LPPRPSAVLKDLALTAQPLALSRPARPVPMSALPQKPEQESEAASQAAAQRQAHEEGLAQGYAEGLKRGEEEGRRRADDAIEQAIRQAIDEVKQKAQQQTQALQQRLAALDLLLKDLPLQIETRLHAVEDDAITLCHETLCRFLGRQMGSPAAIRAQWTQALSELKNRRLVAAHLHPDDLALLRESLGVDAPEIEWVADRDMQLGGCILVSPEGGLDARLETQLDALRQMLIQMRNQTRQQPCA
jgi:flagellar assembly protein FliH